MKVDVGGGGGGGGFEDPEDVGRISVKRGLSVWFEFMVIVNEVWDPMASPSRITSRSSQSNSGVNVIVIFLP